jgi:hypothetical protein
MKNIIIPCAIALGVYLLFGTGYYLSGLPLERCEALGLCFVFANFGAMFSIWVWIIIKALCLEVNNK